MLLGYKSAASAIRKQSETIRDCGRVAHVVYAAGEETEKERNRSNRCRASCGHIYECEFDTRKKRCDMRDAREAQSHQVMSPACCRSHAHDLSAVANV